MIKALLVLGVSANSVSGNIAVNVNIKLKYHNLKWDGNELEK